MITRQHTLNDRVVDATLGELVDMIAERITPIIEQRVKEQQPTNHNYVYGLKGLARLLGCSKTTASRLRTSGDYDDAITQIGAMLIIDADKVLEIARSQKRK